MNNESKIYLELSLDEVNTILQALGDRPFKEVFSLIGKLNEQASNQLQAKQKQED